MVCKLWLEGLSANLEVNKQYVPLTEISSRDEKKQNKKYIDIVQNDSSKVL